MATTFVDLRWLVFLACNLGFCWLVALVDGAAGGFGISPYLYGVCLIFPALRAQPWTGWICVALPALWIEAQTPAPFGLSLTIWTAVWMLLRRNRARVRLDSAPQRLLAAEVANALCFAAVAFCLRTGDAGYWARACVDGAVGAVALAVVAPWFLAFQDCLLRVLRLDFELAEEDE